MAVSGIFPFSIPKADAHTIIGGVNPSGKNKNVIIVILIHWFSFDKYNRYIKGAKLKLGSFI